MSREPTHRVVLVRHAKAEPKHKAAHPDHDRPLTGRGRRDATRTGRWLAGPGPALDRALVSTSVRTRQTWDLIAAEMPEPPAADFEKALYRADADSLLLRLGRLPEHLATVAVVGHNPGFLDLALGLVGDRTGEVRARLADSGFDTAGIVVLTVPTPWARIAYGTAHLDAYWSPRT
ncbi:histidine phosphatase family protein [Kitasatospora sp. MBT63]|uniref:SixA phosphatase family protein n=1 Tax=Kitasatospora sp. MBT63 TaxID=1444768 RepID=UPI00053AB913|nr:histidine phosphatase family protein [Kitasatospora sp. MBT63]